MAAEHLVPRRASSRVPLVATVSLLHSTRPVASARLQHRLEREGRVALMVGTLPRAERLARALTRRGFTPSLNVRTDS
jgi:hypothetical protein